MGEKKALKNITRRVWGKRLQRTKSSPLPHPPFLSAPLTTKSLKRLAEVQATATTSMFKALTILRNEKKIAKNAKMELSKARRDCLKLHGAHL